MPDPEHQTKPPSRRLRRTSGTRKRLFDAALALFAEKGVDACSIEDITERADVGKGTFYRYFRDKHDLLACLADQVLSGISVRIRERKDGARSLEDAVAHIVDAHTEFLLQHETQVAVLLQSRLLIAYQRESAVSLQQPFAKYLDAVEQQLIPFMPKDLEPTTVRRLTSALTGWLLGFFVFATLGLKGEEASGVLKTTRPALIAGLSLMMTAKSEATAKEKQAGDRAPA